MPISWSITSEADHVGLLSSILKCTHLVTKLVPEKRGSLWYICYRSTDSVAHAPLYFFLFFFRFDFQVVERRCGYENGGTFALAKISECS